jgi:hypothetical protein
MLGLNPGLLVKSALTWKLTDSCFDHSSPLCRVLKANRIKSCALHANPHLSAVGLTSSRSRNKNSKSGLRIRSINPDPASKHVYNKTRNWLRALPVPYLYKFYVLTKITLLNFALLWFEVVSESDIKFRLQPDPEPDLQCLKNRAQKTFKYKNISRVNTMCFDF